MIKKETPPQKKTKTKQRKKKTNKKQNKTKNQKQIKCFNCVPEFISSFLSVYSV